MPEFIPTDYIKMQNKMYMEGIGDDVPCTQVDVYGDDGKKLTAHLWHDAIDQPIIDKCKGKLFIKAYTKDGRDGVNVQTSDKIDFSYLGYGPNSTAAVRRLIALTAVGRTLQFLQDRGWDVYPTNDNHLDLRRKNLTIGKEEWNWNSLKRISLPLDRAKYKFDKEN